MIRRLIILLLIVGCNNSNEPDEVSTYWRCGTICDGIWCWDSSFVETALETCLLSGANRAHPYPSRSSCEEACSNTFPFPTIICMGDTCSLEQISTINSAIDDFSGTPYEEIDLLWTPYGEIDSLWTGFVDSNGDTIIWGTPTGLNEYELVQTGLIDSNGKPIVTPGNGGNPPPNLNLAPMIGDICIEYADSSCVEISD